jgi:CheY-like chemotaxis protein
MSGIELHQHLRSAGESIPAIFITAHEGLCERALAVPGACGCLVKPFAAEVRQWQELLHGGRYAESYSHSLPDFVKLAEAYHGVGMRCDKPDELDAAIKDMIKIKKPVIFDCVVDPAENCFPMIPSGRAHNEMLLSDAAESIEEAITEEGKVMV